MPITSTEGLKDNASFPVYLYGAAVQGIQGFIFQTNELKDIVGASEMVEEICTTKFRNDFMADGELIVSAAGNIKCLFTSEEQCRTAVMNFPRVVMEAAPGITISQAVVKTSNEEIDCSFQTVVNRLEERLRAQRNRVAKSLTTGLMAIERSRKTGLPAIKVIKDGENMVFLDSGTAMKKDRSKEGVATLKLCNKSFGREVKASDVALDIKELTDRNDWIAIIHADGNGLGAILANKGGTKEGLHSFSSRLSEATETAAQKAYSVIAKNKDRKKIPIRPVVLSGDDHTVICSADIAIAYAKSFIAHFEEETAQKELPLTACAGIAFIKSSYPFHYGYQLAETLCSIAKKDAKLRVVNGIIPSCLMFYKVQSSFVEKFADIVEKELTPQVGHSFVFGPYYLHEQPQRWTIQKLMELADLMSAKKDRSESDAKDGNAIKSDLRNWMTLMHEGIAKADQRKMRVLQLAKKEIRDCFSEAVTPVKRDGKKCYPAYDILSVSTVENLKTK